MSNNIFFELNSYHDEVLYGLVGELGGEGDCVIVNPNLTQSDLIEDLKSTYDVRLSKSFLHVLSILIKNRRSSKNAIFNTLETPKALFYYVCCFFLGYNLSFVSHNFDTFLDFGGTVKLKKKIFRNIFGNFIIKSSYKIYVLSPGVKAWLLNDEYISRGCLVGKLELLSCKNLLNFIADGLDFERKEQNYYVVVGSVDYSKRNYESIIDFVKGKSVKVRILGDINRLNGIEFIEEVRALGIEDKFVFHDGRLSYKDMLTQAFYSKGILMSTNRGEYGKVKVSASEVFSLGLNIECVEV
ncbi:hypothetical protein [Pseudoalteromonas sp. MEBiC 03485]|uniref:hypothetical protein n=1 Tax=unclassified Pseudoalteromonas TaxID=194690 RepID=UPI00101EE740|nr:hypothetical protein [Pseudoalteromonas sp. MEBiC 03485]RZD21695.1 hypothetical protein EVU92_06345 [Pseudoalteromonas sp. MEBiC 03485]